MSGLVVAGTPDWTPSRPALGALDINGELRQRISLGSLTGSPEFAFPFHLTHALRIDERASEYTVPQLTTYVAPEGREGMLWVEPGGKRHYFARADVLDALPSDLDALPEDRWTMVSERIGDYLLVSRDGWRYAYRGGAIRTLTAPTGRVLAFETRGIRIVGITQRNPGDEEGVTLMKAEHDEAGLLQSLTLGPSTHRFAYDSDTEQMVRWMPATRPETPVTFRYREKLVTTIALPGGEELTYEWADQGDEKRVTGSDFELPEVEGRGAFLVADGDFRYRYGIARDGVHLLRTNRAGQTDGLIWNPKTRQMILRNRDGGEVTRLYGLRGAGNGRLESVHDPEGRLALSLRYDEEGRVIWRKRLGRPPRTFVYDDQDRICEAHRLDRCEKRYEYEGDGELPVKVTNALGHSSEYRYDEQDRLVWYKGLDGDEHRFAYDDFGRLVKHEYPYGYTETWEYDEFGRVVEHEGLDGKVTERIFADGEDGPRLAEVRVGDTTWELDFDPGGDVQRLLRNGELWQRVERERLAEGGSGSSLQGGDAERADAKSGDSSPRDEGAATSRERLRITDATGSENVFDLDSRGNVVRRVDPAGEEAEFRRDELGRLAGWTDPRGVVANFERDAAGRIAGLESADRSSLELRYDRSGRLLERTHPEKKAKFQYDGEGRLTRIEYGAEDEWVTREYDRYGRLARGATADVVTEYAYDDLDRLVRRKETVRGQVTSTIEYRWTPSGKKASRALYRDGKRMELTEYRYDLLGRREGIAVDGETALTYAYDPASLRLETKRFRDGTRVEYRWDAQGRPAVLRTREADGEVRTEVRYRWTDGGKLALRRQDGEQENYYYDPAGRLVAVVRNSVDEIGEGASVLPDPKILAEMNIEIDTEDQRPLEPSTGTGSEASSQSTTNQGTTKTR